MSRFTVGRSYTKSAALRQCDSAVCSSSSRIGWKAWEDRVLRGPHRSSKHFIFYLFESNRAVSARTTQLTLSPTHTLNRTLTATTFKFRCDLLSTRSSHTLYGAPCCDRVFATQTSYIGTHEGASTVRLHLIPNVLRGYTAGRSCSWSRISGIADTLEKILTPTVRPLRSEGLRR